MFYTSTRDNSVKAESFTAIAQGISNDGGLFAPTEFPEVDMKTLDAMTDMSYNERAKAILAGFLSGFTIDEIGMCVESAYTAEKFGAKNPAPIVNVYDSMNMLELWHGPTCAFKDMALQILPHLLSVSSKKHDGDKDIVILVATSGDTGKAALEGFKDAPKTKLLVFYPDSGVSSMQQRQMNTQEGDNLAVCAIKGNFDDAQTGVKNIFTNNRINQKLLSKNMMFSSANSINLGRLLPQIIYYFSAYCELVNNKNICIGDKINFVVPTGNFGNILAAYYALKMGLPVNKLICASNKNNILTDFLNTGSYDKNRSFHTTISPSMDILISSNLERLLFDIYGQNAQAVSALMKSLSNDGKYEISSDIKKKLEAVFYGGYCDDVKTKETIKNLFEKYGYLCDTHTAVAAAVYEEYIEKTGDKTQTVIASTASPYKFAGSVLDAFGRNDMQDEFAQLDLLFDITKSEIPKPILDLKEKEIRFNNVCTTDTMEQKVFELLGI